MFEDVTNADRAAWALSALTEFVEATRVDEPSEAISDLIADLLHLARAKGLNPEALALKSIEVMKEEVEVDEDGDLSTVRRQFEELVPE
jgi:phage terminase small subunit